MKLELRDVAFNYEKNSSVLKGVSFTVDEGEILCLLGPNGAGKTTLFKTILGLLRPQKGTILMDGKDILQYSRRQLARFIGYVPQSHVPPFPYSVMDVVLMGRNAHLNNHRTPSEADYRIARESLATLHISYLEDKNYSRISGGERQLVLIARALTQQAELLILDEPTSNLDFGNQVRVLKKIRHLSNQGLSIIMSSHFPSDAFQNSSKVALLKDGVIDKIGAPRDIVTEENMKKIYGVDVYIANAEDRNGSKYLVCIPVVS